MSSSLDIVNKTVPALKLSIITVCFNSEAAIRQTIASVLDQNYTNVEYILVDGASTDLTMDIIRSFGDQISHVISEPDDGIYDAINKGLAVASGDIVGILNSDDIYIDKYVLQSVAEVFSDDPDIQVVLGNVVFAHPCTPSKILRSYSCKWFFPWQFRFGWMPPHPGSFVSAAAYKKFGVFNATYKIAADFEMMLRLLFVHKLKYFRLDRVLVSMTPGGVSNKNLKSSFVLNAEVLRACRENNVFSNWAFLALKVPFRAMQLISRFTAEWTKK